MSICIQSSLGACLQGTRVQPNIEKVNQGAVNSEMVVSLPNGLEVVSIITKASVDNLGLKEGKEGYAITKA